MTDNDGGGDKQRHLGWFLTAQVLIRAEQCSTLCALVASPRDGCTCSEARSALKNKPPYHSSELAPSLATHRTHRHFTAGGTGFVTKLAVI